VVGPAARADLVERPARLEDGLGVRDDAVAHAHYAPAVRGDIGLVGDHDDGLPELVEPLEDREDLRARVGVEVPRRLVRENHRGIVEQRPRDRDALLLSTGELAGAVPHPIAEADLSKRGEGARAVIVAIAAVHEWQLDVLDGVEAREEVARLEDEADVLVSDRGELVVGQLADVLAGQLVGAGVGDIEAAQHVHQRRLARAGRAHDRDELTGVDVEVDAGEGVDLDLLADAVGLGDAAQVHHWPHRGRCAVAVGDTGAGDDGQRITIPPGPPCWPPRFGAVVAPARACGRITRSPSFRPPPVTSVSVSLEMPNVASTSTGCPSFSTWRYFRVPCVLIARFGTVSTS